MDFMNRTLKTKDKRIEMTIFLCVWRKNTFEMQASMGVNILLAYVVSIL